MAQPSLNGSPTQSTWASATSSLRTVAHTVPSLTSGAILVEVVWADNNVRTITGVTWNGVALTHIGSTYAETATGSARVGVDQFLLVSPAAASANVVVTCSVATLFCQVNVTNWDNVNQSTPTSGGTTGTSAASNLAPSLSLSPTSNDLSVGEAVFSFASTVAPVQTGIGSVQTEGVFILAASSSEYSTGGTISWTAASNDGVAYSAFVLQGTPVPTTGPGHQDISGAGMFGAGPFWEWTRGIQTAGSVALTGVSGAGSPGSLSPSNSVALSGVAGTGAVGGVTPTRTVPLTGNQGTGSVGATVPNTTIGLSGNQATGQVGSVSAGGDVIAGLSGVQASGQVGTLTPNTSKAITGNAATGSGGTVAPSTSIALTGNQASGAVGSVTFVGDITVSLTGVQATGQVGTLVASGGDSNAFDGGFWGKKWRERYLKKPVPETIEEAVEFIQQELIRQKAIPKNKRQIIEHPNTIPQQIEIAERMLRHIQQSMDDDEDDLLLLL